MKPSLGTRIRLAGKAITGLFNENSAKVAYGLLSGIYPTGGPPATRGAGAMLQAYSTMPWLRAVGQKVSQSIAETQWTLSAPTAAGRKRGTLGTIRRAHGVEQQSLIKSAMRAGDLKQIDSHPFLDAIYSANEFLVGNALWRLTSIHLDLIGEAFWIKERDALGTIVGFWPVPPSWITRTPTVSNRTFYATFQGWRGEIPDTEVVWFLDPDPANPYGRGTGIARTLSDELETDEYASQHARMTFLNRARPDFIVYPKGSPNQPGEMGEPAARRLSERWLSEHQGFFRAATPFFATREIGVHEMGQSFSDLQLTELRKFERDTIIQVYGIPPEMLGILENSNRSTIDAADYLFKKNVIVPRLEFLRWTLQERLVPEYDENLIVGYVNPVAEDRAEQVKAGMAAPWGPTVDEWRNLQGLPPMDDVAQGSVHMVPSGYSPVLDLTQPSPATALQLMQPALTQPIRRAVVAESGDLSRFKEIFAEAGDVANLSIVTRASASIDAEDLPPLSRELAKRERAVRVAIQDALNSVSARTSVADITTALGKSDPEEAVADVVDWTAFETELQTSLEQAMIDAFRVGVRVGGIDAGLARSKDAVDDVFNVANPEAVRYARDHAGTLIKGISKATREGIREVVSRAIREGWDAERTARVIRSSLGLTAQQSASVIAFANRLASRDEPISDEKLFARVGRYTEAQRAVRALTIARTEMALAGSAGQQVLWNNAIKRGLLDPTKLVKVWLVARDELLEPICEALADERVAVDGVFSNGLSGPPAHPNCRCATGLKRVAKDATIVVVTSQQSPHALSAIVGDAVRESLRDFAATL